MKTFFLKLLLFGLAIFLVDKAFLIVRNQAPKHDYDKRLEMLLNGKINKELIVIGSSRGESDVYIKMIEDSLNVDAFNLSWGGSPPEFQEFILNKLLEHNKKPKYIIKVLDDDFELTYKADGTRAFRFDRLYPLVVYPEIREELIRQGEKSELLSKLFVLHQLNRSNFDFRMPPIDELKDTIYGNNLVDKQDPSVEWVYDAAPIYDKSFESEKEISHFKSIQDKCKEEGIQLIFVTAPVFREMNPVWLQRMEELTNAPTLFLAHDQNDNRYKDKRYYADLSHLNLPGAAILTHDIVQFLRDNTDIED